MPEENKEGKSEGEGQQKTEPTVAQIKAELSAYKAIVKHADPEFDFETAKKRLFTDMDGNVVYIPEGKIENAQTDGNTETKEEKKETVQTESSTNSGTQSESTPTGTLGILKSMSGGSGQTEQKPMSAKSIREMSTADFDKNVKDIFAKAVNA